MPPIPPPDPETLGIIFLIGGTFAVASFILYGIAVALGPRIESPPPIARLEAAITA